MSNIATLLVQGVASSHWPRKRAAARAIEEAVDAAPDAVGRVVETLAHALLKVGMCVWVKVGMRVCGGGKGGWVVTSSVSVGGRGWQGVEQGVGYELECVEENLYSVDK